MGWESQAGAGCPGRPRRRCLGQPAPPMGALSWGWGETFQEGRLGRELWAVPRAAHPDPLILLPHQGTSDPTVARVGTSQSAPPNAASSPHPVGGTPDAPTILTGSVSCVLWDCRAQPVPPTPSGGSGGSRSRILGKLCHISVSGPESAHPTATARGQRVAAAMIPGVAPSS